jgi:hypothetical protein
MELRGHMQQGVAGNVVTFERTITDLLQISNFEIEISVYQSKFGSDATDMLT